MVGVSTSLKPAAKVKPSPASAPPCYIVHERMAVTREVDRDAALEGSNITF